MKSGKKILVSGVKPTGRPHIGNYFGAIKQMIDLQDEYDCHIFIADLHALTSVNDASQLSQDTLDLAIDYLALGLDPKKVTFYKQSDTPQVTELAWIFNCITTMPYLMRAHAFKDAEAKNHEINVGVFDYPLLMSADILLPGANVVPVGADQKQHIEIARDTAEKFNRLFGETFAMPEALIMKEVMTVPGTDGQKMSKSYGNTIGLFATDDEITKAVMKIPTDSKGVDEPKNTDECKMFALHKLFASENELADIRARYEKGGLGYKESKDILAKNISAFVAPLRARREKIANDPEYVIDLLKEGGKKAHARAEKKMDEIRKKVGLLFKNN
jgi:tryptophanyl-tRNA synthetase